jgi:predicted alpha/beta hydrolase family esterase
MDTPTLLIIPGYHGSSGLHWQRWLHAQVPGSELIDGIDWEQPVLASWAERVRTALSAATTPLTVVAHSFGCLATIVAVADRPDRIADLVLVAPADPDRFDFKGLKPLASVDDRFDLSLALPLRKLQVPGLLVGSRNDPWLGLEQAQGLAQTLGLDFHDAGAVGHINSESGFGPWPWLLETLQRRAQARQPGLSPELVPTLKKGRGSALAAVRQLTREQKEKPFIRRKRF